MFSDVIYWGLPLLALIINGILLLLLGLSKKDKHINVLMFFLLAMMLWAGSSILMKMQLDPGVLFWNRVMVSAITFVPYFAYVFVSLFTNEVKVTGLLGWGGIIIIITTLNAAGVMVTSAEMVEVIKNGQTIYELEYALGPWALFGFGSIFVLLTMCLNKMRKAFNKEDIQRMKIRPVMFGLFVLYIGMVLNALPAIGKYPIDFAAGIIASSLLFYSIYKNNLVELKLVITRTVVTSFIFGAMFVVVAFVTSEFLKLFSDMNTKLNDQMFVLLTTLSTMILFMPLIQYIHKKIDDYFYKRVNLQNDLIKQFTLTVSNNLDLENISNHLLDVANQLSGNNRLHIFLNNQDAKTYAHYSSFQKLDKVTFDIRHTHPFVRWFAKSDETIYDEHLQNHPFFKTMWDVEQHDLLMMRFQAAFPLKYNNNLIGMLLIGHGGNFALQEAEARMLSTLCATASIAISNASMFLKFQEEATKDSLTALYNHRYFIDQMENFCDLKDSAPLSLIMINVDMFSMFNDIYGNQAGDKALIKIADAIKFVCGSMGVLIRYGGDMFAILLEKTDTYFAYEMAEKIRMRVENMSMADNDEVARHLTISIGLSVCPILAKDDKQLIEQANLALDIAKHSGRNKTIIYEPNQAKQDSHHAQPSEEMNMATIYALTAAIDAKDHYTFGHSQRVAKYASAIAQKAGASPEEVNTIRQAALLHDVGKIGIPEHILTKYSKLEDHEYETMKMHVDMSITIIKYLPSFSHVIPAVLGHHERWDGRGYPRQIAGENIAFGARCIGIADAFDAITSNRHYKTLLSVDYALEEIERNAGTQFDPHLAKLFVEMVRSGELIIEPSRTYEN